MDSEGFSGRDGRTSIFDFHTIDSIARLQEVIRRRAWENESVNELCAAGLSVREAELLLRYQQSMQMATDEALFRSGDNYDLNWCQAYNRDELFAFLRCLREPESKTALIVCNFSDRRRQVPVCLPPEVRRYCQRPDLPGEVSVDIPAYDFNFLRL